MELIQSIRDSISVEHNSRGTNWSFSIHAESSLVQEWETIKKSIDLIVSDLEARFKESS